jgi:cytoskeletal protein CcmA (bactofilin family)
MFGNKKDSRPIATEIGSSPAPKGPVAPSLLSADLTITGNLQSAGDMQIDGTVEGDIRSTKLTISNTGVVRGSVEAEQVVIAGHVTGQIKARHVTLNKTARVVADVIQERLTIEPGAFFEGNCRHFPGDEPETRKAEHRSLATSGRPKEPDIAGAPRRQAPRLIDPQACPLA